MNKPLKPWEMTPEQFGKSFVPVRVIGKANTPTWRYDLPSLEACPTRAAAVLDAHKHFVERALEEGVSVPDHVAALYRPRPEPPYERVQAEPDYIRLIADRTNEADAAPARAATANAAQAQRLADTEDALKKVIGAALLAHDDAQKLHSTVHAGLSKSLTEQTERTERTRAEMRAIAAAREAELKEIQARLTATMRLQAQVLAARSKAPDKPKRWRFKIQRDAHGNISGMDAEPC